MSAPYENAREGFSWSWDGLFAGCDDAGEIARFYGSPAEDIPADGADRLGSFSSLPRLISEIPFLSPHGCLSEPAARNASRVKGNMLLSVDCV